MNTKLFVRTALTIALAGAYTIAPSAVAQTAAGISAPVVTHNVQGWQAEPVNPTTTRFVITLDKPLKTLPPNFRGPDGTYVALDFAGTLLAAGVKKTNTEKSDALVTGARWAESSVRTRLVINTKKGSIYYVSLEGNDVVVTVKTEQADKAEKLLAQPVVVSAKPAVAPVITPAANVDKKAETILPEATEGVALLRDIDYKKTGTANGQLTLDLSDPTVKVRVFREGTNLVVDLPNTTLPRNLAKRTRLEQLDTPIQAISPSSSRDGATRLLLEARGGWDYTFQQNGNTISINIVKISDDYRVGGKKVFTGKKMSLSFQQIEVRTVLQVLASFTGLNIIATDSVTGSITLELNDVPWDHALDVVLGAKNLDMRRTGNVIIVAPKEEIMKKEKQDREDRIAIEAAEPTVTETFQVNYHSAEDIRKLLEGSAAAQAPAAPGSLESRLPPLKLRSDKRTNQLFATGTPAQLDEARDVIRSVDVAGRQVTIEAKIIEVSDSFAKNIGVRFGFNNAGNSLAHIGSVKGTMGGSVDGNMSNLIGGTGTSNAVSTPMSVNLPAASINGANPGTVAFTLFNSSLTRFLNLEVSALEADGKAKTISSPRVVTADNEEAIIKQGTEIPYQQASASGATSISFKTAAMVLKVTPQITPNGKISLKLDVNKDSVGQNTTSGPAIDTKAISTKVLVDNGGTIVIGGIFIQDEVTTENKVPVFGDIPLLGNAFKNNGKTTTKKELVIMVTPRVIDSSGSSPMAQ